MSVPAIPAAAGEDDERRMFREALNRSLRDLMNNIDGALRLRSAPDNAKRHRQMARRKLEEAGHAAILAYDASREAMTDASA